MLTFDVFRMPRGALTLRQLGDPVAEITYPDDITCRCVSSSLLEFYKGGDVETALAEGEYLGAISLAHLRIAQKLFELGVKWEDLPGPAVATAESS